MNFETKYDIGEILWHVNKDHYQPHVPPYSIEMVEITHFQIIVKRDGVFLPDVFYEPRQRASLLGISGLEDIRFKPINQDPDLEPIYGRIVHEEDYYKTQEEAPGSVLLELQKHREIYCELERERLETDIKDMKQHLKVLPVELAEAQKKLKKVKAKLKELRKGT